MATDQVNDDDDDDVCLTLLSSSFSELWSLNARQGQSDRARNSHDR